MMPRKVLDYGGHRIVSNQVPEAQFDHGLGFGWGFQVFAPEDREPKYALVIKSIFGLRTKENIEKAFELGHTKVRELIDTSGFEHSYVCFRWEPDPPYLMELTQVDCDEISPVDKRSPYPLSN